VLTSPANEM